MKRVITLIVVLGLVAWGTGVANANILSNGNLNATNISSQVLPTPTGWTVTASRGGSNFNDAASSEGFANANVPDPGGAFGLFFKPFQGNAINGNVTANLYQDKPGTPGIKYTLTGWAGAGAGYVGLDPLNTTTKSQLAIDFDNDNNTANGVISSAVLDLKAGLVIPNGNPFNYKQYTIIGTAPAGTSVVRARASMIDAFGNPAGGDQAFVVDVFELTVTHTVTTTASSGAGSLAAAILALSDGDTIAFNIPGAGPHYIVPPPGGLPLVIKDNVTIDGYSQPGSVRNTNPITDANNGAPKIVLNARGGADGFLVNTNIYRLMAYEQYGTTITSSPVIDNSSMSTERSGYGYTEIAILGVYRATNVNIRGLAFLGSYDPDYVLITGPPEDLDTNTWSTYMIAEAHDYGLNTNVLDRLAYNDGSTRNLHINGCWFGIDPTNQTVSGLALTADAITFFRHRNQEGGNSRPELPNESLIVGAKPGSSNPRAEFNVIAYSEILPLAGEGIRTRFSGNFLGVFPDGVTPTGVRTFFAGSVEIGRYDDSLPIIIGTDGDGVNDADEGNLFGPFDDPSVAVLAFYGTGDKTYRIAGNTIGKGVDGTRWTNSCIVFGEINRSARTKVQFGSDFDGVSDALEANVVYNNYPFNAGAGTPPVFFLYDPGDLGGFIPPLTNYLSMRGNQLVNNLNPPYSPTEGAANFTAYYQPFMDGGNITPVISASSTTTRLVGTCGLATNALFPNIIIDLYVVDQEGLANGALLLDPDLPNGMVQGLKYLGSFVDNSGSDANPAAAAFDFNLTSLGIAAGCEVTITANYSRDAQGTHNGRTQTSPFSAPVTLSGSGPVITVTSTAGSGAGSFHAAMSALSDGATVNFNIPGAGPHFLETPVGGYPRITNHNVTINGYSQPGSAPNNNPILAANNAQIKIVLDSRNTNYSSMDIHSGTNSGAGFGPNDRAIIGVERATNVTIQGLCFLGHNPGTLGANSSIAFAMGRTGTNVHAPIGCHVNGCWLGVHPDGTNVSSTANGITAFSMQTELSYNFRYTNCPPGGVARNSGNYLNPNTNTAFSARELIPGFYANFISTNVCVLTNEPTFLVIATNVNSGNRVGHSGIIIGVAPGCENPRSQFNVVVGSSINTIMEGVRFIIAGNFYGVLPSGVNDYILPFAQTARIAESHLEIGRGASDLIIGTDGDGINDAEERNIFGGVVTDGTGNGSFNLGGYDHVIELYSNNNSNTDDRKRNRFAGNYFGVAVDGVTRFTNGVPALNGSTTGESQYWIGSDFDGVSDDIEANVIYNNFPGTTPGLFYETPYTNSAGSAHGFFDQPGTTAQFALRGNKTVNNYFFPANPQRDGVGANNFVTNYMRKAINTALGLGPRLATNSSNSRVTGTTPPPTNAAYVATIIDFYVADPEGLTNGQYIPFASWTGVTNGWVQGERYLGSLVDNGPDDNNPVLGSFSFDICSFNLATNAQVTATANYSKDPPGTHNARVLTSLFADPVRLGAGIVITSIVDNGDGTVTISWCGGGPTYSIERRSTITGAPTTIASNLGGSPYTTSKVGSQQFYRVTSP